MTNKTKTPLIDIRFEFFPKNWEPGVARRVFDLLIGKNVGHP